MRNWKQRIRQRTEAGLNIAHTGDGDINLAYGPDLEFLREAYKAEALAISPERLLDREAEKSELVRLAQSDGYIWSQGPPWAGKSALMSWFVASPPPSVEIVSFFVNSRLPGEADSRAFIRAMVRQLAEIAGIRIGFEIPEEARSGQLTHLLNRAAQAVSRSGQRLVIVVDGLDEDQGNSPSIAYTLPRRLPAGVRVIVSSRLYPLLPPDLPGDHPLRHCERRTLEPSPHASRIRDDAAYEIARQLTISSHRDLIGLLVAAGGGGLSSRDLAELTGTQSKASIADLLYTEFGRIIDTLPRSGEAVWMLAHDMLLKTARDRLAEELPRYLEQINQWADRYDHEGWPANTPDYLLHSYPHMLLDSGDQGRAIDLAIDRERHELMLSRTSTDALALDEITSVRHSLMKDGQADLKSLALLAFHKFTIGTRSAALPEDLPSVWAELGDLDRGEALARTIVWPEDRGLALIDVAFTIAPVDAERAVNLCASAQAIVPHIDRTGGQVGVLTGIAQVLAAFNTDLAEEFANSLTDPRTVALALAEVASVLTDTDPERAAELCEKAAEVALSIADSSYSMDAFSEPAKVLASIDPDRANMLARKNTRPEVQAAVLIAMADVLVRTDLERAMIFCTRAELLAQSIATPYYREERLAQVVAVVAVFDLSRAKKIAELIADPKRKAEALSNAAVAATRRSPHIAEEIALSVATRDSSSSPLTKFATALAASNPNRSEELAYTINDSAQRASVLVSVMAAIGKRSSERALNICEIAEHLAYSVSDLTRRASLLTDMAAGIGDVSQERAISLCEMAEQTARRVADFLSLGCVAAKIAAALARTEPDRAMTLCKISKYIAENLVDNSDRDFVLAEVAVALAAIEPDSAIRVLESISDGDHYGNASSRMIEVIARIDRPRFVQLLKTIEGPEYIAMFSRQDLGKVMEQVASVDFKRAELIADSISDSDPLSHAMVLTRMARSVLEVEPQEASKLTEKATRDLAAISDPYERTIALAWIASALAQVDRNRAFELLNEAERTAMSITDSRHREMTLATIVYPIAITDMDRARRICKSLLEKDWWAHALADICQVLTEGAGADSAFAWSATASLLAETEYDLWGGDWTSALNLLAVIDPQGIKAVADQLNSELARYPELVELFKG
jgi:hypothetical protein